MNYNKRLYDLRTDNDLKQEDIAKVLNTTKQSYGRYENGTTKLSIEDLIKLAQYYNVSTDYLLGLTDDEKTNWKKYDDETINKNEIKKIKKSITKIERQVTVIGNYIEKMELNKGN